MEKYPDLHKPPTKLEKAFLCFLALGLPATLIGMWISH